MLKGDFKGTEALIKRLKSFHNQEITVGLQGTSGAQPHPGAPGHTIVEVGHWMEYGTSTVPARPFLRTAIKLHRKRFVAALREAAKKIASEGGDVNDELAAVGELAVQKVVDTIRHASRWARRLSDETVAKKRAHGSPTPTKPLLDSHTMVNAISYEVHKK